jgi:hypothetical protein
MVVDNFRRLDLVAARVVAVGYCSRRMFGLTHSTTFQADTYRMDHSARIGAIARHMLSLLDTVEQSHLGVFLPFNFLQ